MSSRLILSVIKYTSALSYCLFYSGTATGIYDRWIHHTSDTSFHLLGIVVACSLLVSLATYLYGYKNFSSSFTALWVGFIFSVLSFTPISLDHPTSSLQDLDLTDILILASVSIRCFRALTERICSLIHYEPVFLTSEEFLLLVGFLAGCSVLQQFSTISILVVAAAVHLTGFHLKSSLSVLSAISMFFVSGLYFFPAVGIKYNPFCMVGFVVWLSFASIIDLYFSKLSLLESWKGFFVQGKCMHRLQLLFLLASLLATYAFSLQATLSRDIAFYTLPLFVLFSVFWICFQVVFFITIWGFVTKLEECAIILKRRGDIFTDNSMAEVLASKGVRHFCLVSQIVTMYTLVSTCFLSVVTWPKNDRWFISSLFVLLPLECVMYDILTKLGKCVGGTAIGYAIVSPAHRYSPFGDIVLLAENAFQAVNSRAMELINIVSRFFANHMIHNYGTDFSTSGISSDYIQSKVKSFFEQRVIPGLHYDTYILYYSGQVMKDGNWALTDNKSLTFDKILSWWRETNSKTGARLILFLDTAHSNAWLNEIWDMEEFIAIQTGKLTVVYDSEMGNMYPLGELTKLWENFDTSDLKPENYWNKKDLKVKPIYGVSKEFCSFKFHEPTIDDIAQHVEQNFPRFIKPITKVFTRLSCNMNIFCFCDYFMNSCRRLKMKWFPPTIYDTGHGFKLVR